MLSLRAGLASLQSHLSELLSYELTNGACHMAKGLFVILL